MRCSEDYFYTIDDTQLFYQHCIPDFHRSPETLLIIVHGLGEHCHRYQHLIDWIVSRDMAVATYDLRGHGRSEGKRGHIRSFRQYLTDLRQFVQLCRALHPSPCRFFLLGHSLGGLIVLRYCLERTESLDGLIASGPALGVKFEVPAYKKVLAKAFSTFLPSLRFQNEIHPHLLSRDHNIVEGYLSDPLVHHEATARFYTESIRIMEEVRRDIGKLRIPILFLQGEDDRIVDSDVTLRAFQKIDFKDKTLKTYTANLHEVFNDLDKQRVFEDLYQWIQKHL